MTRTLAVVAVLVALVTAPVLTQPVGAQDGAPVWEPEAPVKVADGLTEAVDVAFGRDGYAYYAELTGGQVRRIALDTGAVDPEPVADIPGVSVDPFTETGLFGLALHPEFHANGVMYVSYSHNESGTWTNVLSRIVDGNETVLMERPGAQFHNGGRVLVADGYLWWTSGDATNPWTEGPEKGVVAQDPDVMRGKVMRLTLDGAPADGNPWGNAAWTLGHRNVYGIAWDPENARMFVTENGNAEADELNILAEGANFGWPECEGSCAEPRSEFVEPIHAWEGTVAPTGAAWFRGAFWFGTFNKGDVHRMSDRGGSWELAHVYHYPGSEEMPPRVLDVERGPDGTSLWFTTWDELWRMNFPDDPIYPGQDPLAGGPYWWEPAAPDPGDGNETGPDEDPEEESWLPIPVIGFGIVLAVAVAVGLMAPRRLGP